MNTSLDRSIKNSNGTEVDSIRDVLTYIIVSIGLPLILVVIYALYLLVRDGHVTPIYVINLLITDLIQLCSMIAWLTRDKNQTAYNYCFKTYKHCMGVSVGFMVCVAMERYLVIAHPLWYRFRRTIKSSVAICVVVWVLPISFFWYPICVPYFLLLPFPFLIFFLVGTVKALSASISVPSDEKRRIVGILVLVLLIYTLLFLPLIILVLIVGDKHDDIIASPASLPVQLCPLADLLLYVFMKKGIIEKLLASVCCYKMDSNDISNMDSNDTGGAGSNDVNRMDCNKISDNSSTDSNDVSKTDSNDISNMDSNDTGGAGSNDVNRMDCNNISDNISSTDSNDVGRIESNDISRMESNDVSKTDSNDISNMDSNDTGGAGSNDVNRMDCNNISDNISSTDSNDVGRIESNDISRMESNDVSKTDSNDISNMDSNDTGGAGSNNVNRMDCNNISNNISSTDSNDVDRIESNDISRMESNDVSKLESNDISSPSV
ncbi:C-C chemokine receptor type 2-like [Sparus aurata]|uniref:C-C chemokine receptor type 2-like n=1 Tax=Sparus aurata TaxID=8175 RepID=UPI0011C1A6F4|nr:C-C chemokine receptor type 2-like [Sparus aurata]